MPGRGAEEGREGLGGVIGGSSLSVPIEEEEEEVLFGGCPLEDSASSAVEVETPESRSRSGVDGLSEATVAAMLRSDSGEMPEEEALEGLGDKEKLFLETERWFGDPSTEKEKEAPEEEEEEELEEKGYRERVSLRVPPGDHMYTSECENFCWSAF